MTWDRSKITPRPTDTPCEAATPVPVTPPDTYAPLAEAPGSVPPWPPPGEEGLAPDILEALHAQGIVLDEEWDPWARLLTWGGER